MNEKNAQLAARVEEDPFVQAMIDAMERRAASVPAELERERLALEAERERAEAAEAQAQAAQEALEAERRAYRAEIARLREELRSHVDDD